MSKTLTFFAAALLSSGFAFADAPAADNTAKTRAQVIAELTQARSSGELARMNSEDSALFQQKSSKAGSTKSRAQVVAELQQARDSGELALLNTDDTAASLNGPTRLAAKQQRGTASAE